MSTSGDTLWLSLPIPAFIIDGSDVIDAVNPAGETYLNTSARHITGKPILGTLAIDTALDEQFARVRKDQAPLFMNNVDVGAGRTAPQNCNIQIAPMMGHPDQILLMMEPRLIAERLDRSMSVKAAAKSAIGMAEMLAHEIKNPLAGITGAAQLLSMNLSNGDLEMTDLIVAESRRIVALLEQVEQFGNLRPPERQVVNIHDLLDRARRSAQVGFAAHMNIVERYDPSLPSTYVDSDQMLQVFLNLMRNASEAADKEGTITLRTFYDMSLRLRRKDGTASLPLQVEIVDDGPGLPPEIAADAFEPFVSGKENGTGLGLALVSKIINDHGGWISVDSIPGQTVFRISLPVAPKDAATA